MIEEIGYIGIGACLGLVLGLVLSKIFGLSPRVTEAIKAMNENTQYYKTRIQRMQGQMKEYEQPSDIQRLSHGANLENIEGLVTQMLNSSSIPKWIRPFITGSVPSIVSWAKEHPDTVKGLMEKFSQTTNQENEFGQIPKGSL
jgi:hypothetical protein